MTQTIWNTYTLTLSLGRICPTNPVICFIAEDDHRARRTVTAMVDAVRASFEIAGFHDADEDVKVSSLAAYTIDGTCGPVPYA